MPSSKASEYVIMFETSLDRCAHNGNIAESELRCVSVATLLRNKYASILRMEVMRQYMSELSRYLFQCSSLPSFKYCPVKRHRDCSGHTLVRTS